MLGGVLNEIGKLDAIDPSTLSDAEVEQLTVEHLRAQSLLSAHGARFAAEWDRRKVWTKDGSRSAAAYLGRHANVSKETANRDLSRGRRLRHTPLVKGAFEAGAISMERADLMGRVNTAALRSLFARDEALLVGHAKTLSWDDFRRVVAKWKDCAEDEAGHDPSARRHRDRRLNIVPTVFGSTDIAGHGPILEGSIIQREVDRIAKQLFADDLAKAKAEWGDDVGLDKLWRDAQQRRWDALVLMATRSASLPDGATLKRPLLNVVISYPDFADICQLAHNLVDVHPHDVARLLGDFDVERIVYGPNKRVLEVGKRERVFRGALRRGIEIRDRHCQLHPDCRIPAEDCQVDHTIEHEDGGLTSDDNGKLGCGPHNRWKHNQKRRRGPPGTS